MMWPLLIGGGVAAWKLWPKLCTNSEVQVEAQKLVKAWTDLDLASATAMKEGKLQPNSTFVTQMAVLKANIESWYSIKILGDLNKIGTAGPNTLACKYRDEGTNLSKDIVQLSSDFARLSGYESPVKTPPMEDGWFTQLVPWALLAGGGYLVYKIMTRGGGETIPRAQLPQYAGGKRRLRLPGSKLPGRYRP